jgi:hypothetical protein
MKHTENMEVEGEFEEVRGNRPKEKTTNKRRSQHTLYVQMTGELHTLEKELRKETSRFSIRPYFNLVEVQTNKCLSHWVQTKHFNCSDRLVKGIIHVSPKAALPKKLPDGIVRMERFGETATVAVTFFNGFWLAEALLNRLLVCGMFREVFPFISDRKKLSTGQRRSNEKSRREEILKEFSEYHKHTSTPLVKTLKTVQTTASMNGLNQESWAAKAAKVLWPPKAPASSFSAPEVAKKQPQKQQITSDVVSDCSPKEMKNLKEMITKLKAEVELLRMEVAGWRIAQRIQVIPKMVTSPPKTRSKSKRARPNTPTSTSTTLKSIQKGTGKTNMPASSEAPAPEQDLVQASPSKSVCEFHPSPVTQSFQRHPDGSSKHRESLLNPQPSNENQDGPQNSRDKDSLTNQQYSTESQDASQQDAEGKNDDIVTTQERPNCPFYEFCSSKRTYKSYKLLRSHLNDAHKGSLHSLPPGVLDKLRREGRGFGYCPRCHYIVPLRRSHRCGIESIRLASFEEEMQLSPPEENSQREPLLTASLEITWDEIARFDIPLIKEVPVKFRPAMNLAWSRVLEDVLQEPSDENRWKMLFLLPSLILHRSRDPEQTESLNSKLRNRLDVVLRGDGKQLLAQLCQKQNHKSKPDTKNSSRESKLFNRINWLVAEGAPSKALRTLMSSGTAAVDARSYRIMVAKHPIVEEENMSTDFIEEPAAANKSVLFQPEHCLAALRSFDRTTGAGPSRTRIPHILDCILSEPPSSQRLLELFSKLLSALANGHAPPQLSVFVAGARLIALEKPKTLNDGLPDLRPIAVGELLRRWVSKVLLHRHKDDITEYFHPLQLGVGTPCGAEIIYRAYASRSRKCLQCMQ